MTLLKPQDSDQASGLQKKISRRSILGLLPATLFLRGAGFAQAVDPAKASENRLTKVRPIPLNAVRLDRRPSARRLRI